MVLALSSVFPKASFLPTQLMPFGNHELAEAGGRGLRSLHKLLWKTVVVFLPSDIPLLEDSLKTAKSKEFGSERV